MKKRFIKVSEVRYFEEMDGNSLNLVVLKGILGEERVEIGAN